MVVELDDLGIHVPASRECQQLIGEPRAEHRRLLRLLQQDLLFIAVQLRVQELVVSGDDQQQVVEIVRNAAGELSDGLHLLSLGEPALALSQRFLHMLAVTQVVDHAGEITPPVRFELADGEVEWEGRAVLAPTAHLAADTDDLSDPG